MEKRINNKGRQKYYRPLEIDYLKGDPEKHLKN